MNDEEFDVLDELYFIISFGELQERLDLDRGTLQQVLIELKRKEFFASVSSAGRGNYGC